MTSNEPQLHLCMTFWHQLILACLQAVTCFCPPPPSGCRTCVAMCEKCIPWKLPAHALTHAHFALFPSLFVTGESHTHRLLLLVLWKQRSVCWHLTWLEYLCFNISKRCKLPSVFRGPSCLHSTNLCSQESSAAAFKATTRRDVKYFDSPNHWMMAVLLDVFPISLRQSGFFLNILRIFPVYLPSLWLCQPPKWPVPPRLHKHTGLLTTSCHHSPIPRQRPNLHSHENMFFLCTFSSCWTKEPKATPEMTIWGNKVTGNLGYFTAFEAAGNPLLNVTWLPMNDNVAPYLLDVQIGHFKFVISTL